MVDPRAGDVTSRSRKLGSPVPANHRLGPNEVERLSPPGPMVGEPHPEEAIEAPELRPLRSAAEHGELLPERQVLEREVGASFKRRTQGAQQSEYEGHCCPWLAHRSPLVQSPDGVLANDRRRDRLRRRCSDGPHISPLVDASQPPPRRRAPTSHQQATATSGCGATAANSSAHRVSRARITQIMELMMLAPEKQEEVLGGSLRAPLRRRSSANCSGWLTRSLGASSEHHGAAVRRRTAA